MDELEQYIHNITWKTNSDQICFCAWWCCRGRL